MIVLEHPVPLSLEAMWVEGAHSRRESTGAGITVKQIRVPVWQKSLVPMVFDNLAESMAYRIEAIIEADRWYTKH